MSSRDPDNPSTWPTLQKVVELFIFMGCERDPPTLAHHPRVDTATDRMFFLVNPEVRGAFVHVMGADSDPIAPSIVENWERRLRKQVPHNWPEPLPPGPDDDETGYFDWGKQ